MPRKRGRALAHYRSPFLTAHEVAIDPDANGIVLRDGDRELSLEVSGDVQAAARVLRDLQDPGARIWNDVDCEAPNGLHALVDQLDRCGWLLEADESGAASNRDRSRQLDAVCDKAVAWLRDAQASRASEMGQSRLARSIATSEQIARAAWEARLSGVLMSARTTLDGIRAADEPMLDVAMQALRFSFISWQRTSPLTLQVLANSLSRAVGEPTASSASQSVEWDASGLVFGDIDEVRKQVWAALELIMLHSTGSWAARSPAFMPTSSVSGPGVNVLVAAERCSERLVAELGRSPVFEELNSPERAARVAQCVYQHQYFVTIRYVEAILSFLRYRLRGPVRRVGFRYLNEEQGHEVLELAACVNLGVPQSDVRAFSPFGLFTAYPEVLGVLAEINPLSFCLAVTVAEGLPGAGKPLPAALAASVRATGLNAHADIDINLDHGQFTRRLLSELDWIPPAEAQSALADFLFVVELSQLAWHQVARYASRPDLPATPRPFALSPNDVFAIWGDK